MKRKWIALVLGCAVSLSQAQPVDAVADLEAAAAVALKAASTLGATVEVAPAASESGMASWYGPGFHGRKTASGETFNMDALTAAHPNLPFGSWVRVQNTVDGRSVDVRINDRGPHIKQRVIDLSRGAAKALGLVGQGTRKVAITVLTEAQRLIKPLQGAVASSIDAATERR